MYRICCLLNICYGFITYLWTLTHWGRVTHICVSELTIIGLDNGLSPGRRQAIVWNNAGLLLIEPLWTNVSEVSIGIQTFSFKNMHLNMSVKWRPSCLTYWLTCCHAFSIDRRLYICSCYLIILTCWGWMTHICSSEVDNPCFRGRHQCTLLFVLVGDFRSIITPLKVM